MDDSTGPPIDAGESYAERRSVPRFCLIAQSEIFEPQSGLRIAGRVSEVSGKGCYVDLLNTLPVETIVEVSIARDRGTFRSPGRVIYTQEGMGMGIAFLDAPADQLKILDEWLEELQGS